MQRFPLHTSLIAIEEHIHVETELGKDTFWGSCIMALERKRKW